MDRESEVRGEEEEKRKHLEGIRWEILEPKKLKKNIWKPIEIKKWFGSEETDSSSESSEDEPAWTDVKRKEKAEEKRKTNREVKKRMERETSARARNMLGLGLIVEDTMKFFETKTGTREKARLEAVNEFLRFHLDFDDEDLGHLDIRETKEGKEDLIYIDVGNHDMLREIHVCKAESENDDIFVRNFIPPQIYKRYMAVSRKCNEDRKSNKDLKTQIRY